MSKDISIYWLESNHNQFINFSNEVNSKFDNFKINKIAQIEDTSDIKGNYVEHMSVADIARTASHLKMIQEWLTTSDTPYALFLEDTIDLSETDKWLFSLTDIIDQLPENFAGVQLQVIREDGIKSLHCSPWCPSNWGGGAYILTRVYAEKLIKLLSNSCGIFLKVPGNDEVRPYVESVIFTAGSSTMHSFPLFYSRTNNNLTASDLDIAVAKQVAALWQHPATLSEMFAIEPVSEKQIRVNDNSMELSKSRDTRAIVVDNFFKDPYAVRELALAQEYHDDEGYIGRRTRKQFLNDDLKHSFERLLGKKITKWEDHSMNGRFQHNWAGERLVYHCDEQTYAAIIYLTPDAPFETGTSFWAHKKTRIHHNSHPDIMQCFNQRTFVDRTPYELVDTFGNVFNRLVIFDGGCIHSATEYFGDSLGNCRLWQMFFFDAE